MKVCANMSLMGSVGCGKTCFLAGLQWLGAAQTGSRFNTSGENANSQSYLNGLYDALKKHTLPAPTHTFDELQLKVSYRRTGFSVQIQDFAGEEFKRAAYDGAAENQIYRSILGSKYLLILLDVEKDVMFPGDNSERLDALMHLLHSQQEIVAKKRIAVIITKADKRPEDQLNVGPSRFLARRQPHLKEKLDALEYDINYFFVSSLGSDMTNGESPAPKGYDEVFSWLVRTEEAERFAARLHRHRKVISVGVCVLALGVLFWGFRVQKEHVNEQIIDSPSSSSDAIAEATGKLSPEKKAVKVEERVQFFDDRFKSPESLSTKDLEKLYDEISDYEERVRPGDAQMRKLVALRGRISDEIENRIVIRIHEFDDQDNADARDSEISAYYSNNRISHVRKNEIRLLKDALKNKATEALRQKIYAMSVDVHAKPRDVLNSKMLAVGQFPYPTTEDKGAALHAVEVMRKLLENTSFTVTFRQASRLKKKHPSYLRVELPNMESFHADADGEAPDSVEPTWDCSKDIKWSCSDSIRVEWKCRNWGVYHIYAQKEIEGDCFALLKLLDDLELDADSLTDFEGGKAPRIKVSCSKFPTPGYDIQCIRRFLIPGEYWKSKER